MAAGQTGEAETDGDAHAVGKRKQDEEIHTIPSQAMRANDCSVVEVAYMSIGAFIAAKE